MSYCKAILLIIRCSSHVLVRSRISIILVVFDYGQAKDYEDPVFNRKIALTLFLQVIITYNICLWFIISICT